MCYVWLKHTCFGIDRRPIVVHNWFFINLKVLPIFRHQPKRIPKMYYESLNNTTMRDSMYPIPKVYINLYFLMFLHIHYCKRMLMEYSIGKQRSPFGFQSHPKYSRNKNSSPKSVITAKFGSMSIRQTSMSFAGSLFWFVRLRIII